MKIIDTHRAKKISHVAIPSNAVGDYKQYNLSSLAVIRDKLNKSKTKLDYYYKNKKTHWDNFSYKLDLYKKLRGVITDKYNGQHVTNAWLKYFEIYNQYSIGKDGIKAFFNAELPGAALCAFNHYMVINSWKYDYVASSLMGGSTDNTALDDVYGLYKNSPDHWLMNKQNNGDATSVKNLLDFEKRAHGRDLYSHDAGIDVSNDFNNQEVLNAKVHLGCAIAGLLTLDIGGTFIAKQYTCFETFTWNLILIYASMFDEFYLCKPVTSRPYNSEIYLIGKGYKGFLYKDKLMSRMENFNMLPLLPADIVKGMPSVAEIESFSSDIFGTQAEFIDESIRTFNARVTGDIYKDVRASAYDKWIKEYNMDVISKDAWLPSIR